MFASDLANKKPIGRFTSKKKKKKKKGVLLKDFDYPNFIVFLSISLIISNILKLMFLYFSKHFYIHNPILLQNQMRPLKDLLQFYQYKSSREKGLLMIRASY